MLATMALSPPAFSPGPTRCCRGKAVMRGFPTIQPRHRNWTIVSDDPPATERQKPMHPAYSVIIFTTASGAGYGLLIWLGLLGPLGWVPQTSAFGFVGLGLALLLI